MYQFNIQQIISFLENNPQFLNDELASCLFNKAKLDLQHYHHIDFYAENVSTEIAVALLNVKGYLDSLKQLLAIIDHDSTDSPASEEMLLKLKNTKKNEIKLRKLATK